MTHHPPDDSPKPDLDAAWQKSVMAVSAPDRVQSFITSATHNQLQRLRFLQAAAPADITPAVLNRALVQAAGRGKEPACIQLLAWGAEARHDHSRALIEAIKANAGQVVDLLLRHGARMEDALHYGRTVSLLPQALDRGNASAAKALLLHGANPNIMHPTLGISLYDQARRNGMLDTSGLMARLWPNPPLIPADFAQRLPLAELRGAFPTHQGFTGFQLAAYHGQIDTLLARLTENGRALDKSDLITATPRYPQTLLFILGQRGELAKVFDPVLWRHDVAAMRDVMRYVPAGFRGQLDAAGIPARLQQEILRQQKKSHLRLKPR